jgi:hypothetical protein
MKTKLAFLLYAFTLIMLPGLSFGQSITINSVSTSTFCGGTPVSVTFTATGPWGHKNAFTLQLSDTTGSFMNGVFTSLGSISDTIGGTFTINSTIPANAIASVHYRLRILGAVPYTPSADNGSDLTVGGKPLGVSFRISGDGGNGASILTGDSAVFLNDFLKDTSSNTYLWDFGEGASPATSTSAAPAPVYYSTAGSKTISLTVTSPSGCSKTYVSKSDSNGRRGYRTLTVYSCSPIIPHSAKVDSVTKDYGTGDGSVWVQPGITFIAETGDFIVYAEPGSSVHLPGTGNLTIYLKNGATYTGGETGSHLLIYEPGVGLNSLRHEKLLKCSSLNFDYSIAPPNRFHPLEAVNSTKASENYVQAYPNPALNMLFIETSIQPTEISLFNLLGQQVLHAQGGLTSKLQIDISQYPSGTYYLRVVSAGGVSTKKIIKE